MVVQFQLNSVESYQGMDFQSCNSIKCASFHLEKLPKMWGICRKYLVYNFSVSTLGRLFPLLGLEAAQPSAQPKENRGAAAAHPCLFPLVPHTFILIFYVLSFCTGSNPLCAWVRLVSSSSPCRHWPLWEQGCACLCSHGREEGISPGGDPQQSVQMWSAQIWGCGTWRPGWDAPLRTSGVTVRR